MSDVRPSGSVPSPTTVLDADDAHPPAGTHSSAASVGDVDAAGGERAFERAFELTHVLHRDARDEVGRDAVSRGAARPVHTVDAGVRTPELKMRASAG